MKYVKFGLSLVATLVAALAFAQSDAAQLLGRAVSLVERNQPDSAAWYFEEALCIYQDSDSLSNWIDAHKAYGKAWYKRKTNPRPAMAVRTMHQATERYLWRLPRTKREWDKLTWLYTNLAHTNYQKLENFEQALAQYEWAIRLQRKHIGPPDRLVAKHIYKRFGNLNTRLGDLPLAETYLRKAIDVFQAGGAYRDAAMTASDLAIVQRTAGDLDRAVSTLEAALDYPGIRPDTRALLRNTLGVVYMDMEQYGEAMRHIDSSIYRIDQLRQVEQQNYQTRWLASFLSSKGGVLLAQSRLDDAEMELREAQRMLLQVSTPYQNRELAGILASLAEVYQAKGDYARAINTSHEILEGMLDGFAPRDWRSQPTPASLHAENRLNDALLTKAKALEAWYEETSDPEMLTLALECYQSVGVVEQHQRRAYRYEASQLFNLADAQRRSESAISLALRLAQLTGDDRYLETAFAFAEQNKSQLLLEAFYHAKAADSGGLPSKEQAKERELQRLLAETEKQLLQARSQGADTVAQSLALELDVLKQQYEDWILELEQSYPSYYQTKYNASTYSATAVREQLLLPDQAFVEYFVGQRETYAFVITAEDFKVVPLGASDSLEQQIAAFRYAIEQFQYSNSDRTALCRTYNELGYRLYEQLLAPLEEAMTLPEELVVVPSGALGLLPFDAMLTELPAEGCRFGAYPYVLHHYNISYAYSANLHAALLERPTYKMRFASFAPVFTEQGPFEALSHNVDLAKNLRASMGGRLFENNTATINNLQTIAGRYSLFHFATHAKANTDAGELSFILFSDGTDHSYDSLFVRDIYVLPLQAEMVVLSACETAVGKLHRGEGIINLARGFLYAGANSVVTTQWSINDATSQELMEAFYGHLRGGYTKSDALRQAKLEQVAKGGQLYAHPVYWAAFAPLGNMRPSPPHPVWARWAVCLGGVALIGLLMVRFRGQRSLSEGEPTG